MKKGQPKLYSILHNSNSFFLIQAVKETARRYGTSASSVRKILKEKQHFNNVIDPPNTRVTYTAYEKLTVAQRDQIRKKVILKLSIISLAIQSRASTFMMVAIAANIDICYCDVGDCCKY